MKILYLKLMGLALIAYAFFFHLYIVLIPGTLCLCTYEICKAISENKINITTYSGFRKDIVDAGEDEDPHGDK